MDQSSIVSKFHMLYELITAICLLMVIESLLPLISPKVWKKLIKHVCNQTDTFIRGGALIFMITGSIFLYFLRK